MIVIGADPHKPNHAWRGRKPQPASCWAADGGGVGRRARAGVELGRGRSTASGSGRSRTAGTCLGGWSVSWSRAGSGSCGWRRADGRRSALERGAASPIRSTRWRSRGRRCGRGSRRFPAALLDERALEIKLLLDHRDDLVAARTGDPGPVALAPARSVARVDDPGRRARPDEWLDRLGRRLARPSRGRVCGSRGELVVQIRARARGRELEREIAGAGRQHRPELLELPGCGPLTAAKLIAETAGAERFHTDAQFARPPGSLRSRSARGAATAIASTAAATANSIARCTASPSTAAATTPTRPNTSPANKPKGKTAWKPCAASNATLPAASTDSSPTPPGPLTSPRP